MLLIHIADGNYPATVQTEKGVEVAAALPPNANAAKRDFIGWRILSKQAAREDERGGRRCGQQFQNMTAVGVGYTMHGFVGLVCYGGGLSVLMINGIIRSLGFPFPGSPLRAPFMKGSM
jgi:hypothetical protein